MKIIVLGGTNDKQGNLSDYTKKRCNFASKINNNYEVHFSGGFNKKFNQADKSHAEICRKYFKTINKSPKSKLFIHEETNNTVDEAIYFSNYFKNNNNKIIIITNDWHYERVYYLFSKTFMFNKINNFEIIGVESVDYNSELINEEKIKIKQLKSNPYGIWKEWLSKNNYLNE